MQRFVRAVGVLAAAGAVSWAGVIPGSQAAAPSATQGAIPAAAPRARDISFDPATREAARLLWRNKYQSARDAQIGWSGSVGGCAPGNTSYEFRKGVLRRINYFRAMAGVPADIAFDPAYNQQAQAAALMMSANNSLSHSPPASWACFSSAGATGASSGNLALGAYGAAAITLYVLDPGGGNAAVGHRRWLLYPQTRTMGTGDVNPAGRSAANALKVFDGLYGTARPATRDPFVAWPPEGYVPYQVVSRRWSLSVADADFSAATVSVTRNGGPYASTKLALASGFGENTLVWEVAAIADGDTMPIPASDTRFRVTVSGVKVGGVPRTYRYDVVVFDPAVPTCGPSGVTVDLSKGQSPTSGSDVILGTNGPDVISAGRGDDVVCGRGGNDTINGGFGRDRIYGGAGTDTCTGGDGTDKAYECEAVAQVP